jgi:hypothetical protein
VEAHDTIDSFGGPFWSFYEIHFGPSIISNGSFHVQVHDGYDHTTITSELSRSYLPLRIIVENNDDNGRFITFCSLRIGTLFAILLGAREVEAIGCPILELPGGVYHETVAFAGACGSLAYGFLALGALLPHGTG